MGLLDGALEASPYPSSMSSPGSVLSVVIFPEEARCRSFFFTQDELEFGYIDAPHKSFPVVFDSPRNRGLRDFALKRILVCGQVHRAGMEELGVGEQACNGSSPGSPGGTLGSRDWCVR